MIIWGDLIKYIIIFILLGLAVKQDVKSFKVSNKLNLAGCLIGIFHSLLFYGIDGLWHSMLGIIIPFVMLFPLFLFGLLGAGDIKLLSAIGSFLSKRIIVVIVLSFCLVAVFGVFVILKRILTKQHSNLLNLQFTKIHMTIPIGFGTIAYLLVYII